MKKQFHLTPDGVTELKAELAELVSSKRRSCREVLNLPVNSVI